MLHTQSLSDESCFNLDKHVDMGLIMRKPDLVPCKQRLHILTGMSCQRYTARFLVKAHIKALLLGPVSSNGRHSGPIFFKPEKNLEFFRQKKWPIDAAPGKLE